MIKGATYYYEDIDALVGNAMLKGPRCLLYRDNPVVCKAEIEIVYLAAIQKRSSYQLHKNSLIVCHTKLVHFSVILKDYYLLIEMSYTYKKVQLIVKLLLVYMDAED